jgi:hypothetical protein
MDRDTPSASCEWCAFQRIDASFRSTEYFRRERVGTAGRHPEERFQNNGLRLIMPM